MTFIEGLMWLVVAAVGIPSAWRNPTAAALVAAWMAGQTYYVVTGNNIPVGYYLYPDLFVLAVITVKMRRSGADWIVAAIFPVCWVFYVIDIDARSQWLVLTGLTIAQFLAAGVDAFLTFRRASQAAGSLKTQSDDLFRRLAWGRGYG